jgi:germination protein M
LRGRTTINGMRYAIVSLSVVLAGLLGVVAASCGSGSSAQSVGPVPTGVETNGASIPTTTLVGTGSGTDTEPASKPAIRYQVWFHRGEQLYVAPRETPSTPRIGTTALESLLAGPTEEERLEGIQTQVPDGTELLGLAIDKGIAKVNLTSEYESGGGSASMSMRLAQVVFTLTQFPTVEGVQFALDGEPIEVLGGEGVVIEHPLTRKDYADLLPAILVESPSMGESVPNPVKVSGTANVYEANVTVIVLDAKGKEIARTFTTATCGSGCRGEFSVTLPYKVGQDQEGTIVVQDDDAAGTGHPPHVVEIPVRLSA